MKKLDYYSTHGFPPEFNANRFDNLDAETRRAIARQGGLASGRARRRRALIRDSILDSIYAESLKHNLSQEFFDAVEIVMKKEKAKRKRRKSANPAEKTAD